MKEFMRKGAAVFLAALLAVPVQPAAVAYGAQAVDTVSQEAKEGEHESVASPGNATLVAEKEVAEIANSVEKRSKEEVRFNTGTYEVSVVDQETFEEGDGDAFFEEDGSYTINIPESNPFFPYEVQFTGENGTSREWFMTPDDSVEIDGHEFYVSAYFDSTAVTQMSFNVAGDTVVVYPEKKEFTKGDGVEAVSLLPLERRYLRADLTGYTPVELTMVKIESIFTGEETLKDTDQVIWACGDDRYTISSPEDTVNFSQGYSWTMIVGVGDQLAADNIRYSVYVDKTSSQEWLIPTVYQQDREGNREKLTIVDSYYADDMHISVPRQESDAEKETYIGLKVNTEVFEKPDYDHFKVYDGVYLDPLEAEKDGTDVTAQLFAEDMEQKDSGIQYMGYHYDIPEFTMVSYDSTGTITGCLPFSLYLSKVGSWIYEESLWTKSENGWKDVRCGTWIHTVDGCRTITFRLRAGYPADSNYFLELSYYDKMNNENPSAITAAYMGQYSSIQEAEEAKAPNIKESLFNPNEPGEAYKADYSKGVYFTVFVGEDGLEEQEIYKLCIQTEETEETVSEPVLSDSTFVEFIDLRDSEGNYVRCYSVDSAEDSYGDYSYRTILVDKDVDLTKLAPEFDIYVDGINLYASEGGSESVLQVSGESVHDFSKGPVHYTASAESKKTQRNYWLQVVKPEEGVGSLYINSLVDPDAETKAGNGTVVSTREMILDGRYDYIHDIVVINTGTETIEKLSVEIDSAEVELDPYWTLKGQYSLGGFDKVYQPSNIAKIRILPKENADDGRDISGTLKIKSGDKVLVELTLTGTVGDPSIITTEIPEAVKYVPYGTMIQNSNKYEWNEVSYELLNGKLPAGMVIKPNGELYGVPTETGEFTFTVLMENSYERFSESVKTFTLKVIENTDANVDAATDQGYRLTNRIQDITLSSSTDQTMVSEGVYDEFVDLYLDGEKLVKDEDYTSESGSTRITIKSQTLKRSNTTGTHTLGIEFRTKDTDTLKRAAQNYEIKTRIQSSGGSSSGSDSSDGSSSGGNGSGSSSSGGSSSGSSNSGGNSSSSGSKGGRAVNTPSETTDSKKGYVNSAMGIITGEGAGYSHWVQDDNGWRLMYSDGTTAAGSTLQLENGDTVEQILWEQVNGSWYAFGINGYLKSGWVYDYQLNGWYLTSVDNGMQSGWYTDPQDGYTYYMEPGTGKMAAGWKVIDGKWYYFQAVSQDSTWELNKETGNWFYNTKSKGKPFGSMYCNERTPDGYVVNSDGSWNGESKQ